MPDKIMQYIPRAKVEHIVNKDNSITLKVRRFKSEWLTRMLVPRRKSPYVNVHLDALGSEAWLLIDGYRSFAQIAAIMAEKQDTEKEKFTARFEKFAVSLIRGRLV
jgi:hypothetical protein